MGGGPPSFPQGFTCLVVLWSLSEVFSFHLQDCYLLWWAFPDPFGYNTSSFVTSPQPQRGKPLWFGLIPVRSPLLRESIFSFSSFGYLDVSVPRVPLNRLCIHLKILEHYPKWVSPFGNLRLKGCLHLPEAYRSLPRPSSAPNAKASALCP